MSKNEESVDLIEVSNRDLGFKDGACYLETCKRAYGHGLKFCPNEVGPQWCLQFKDQPNGTFVVVGMRAVEVSDDRVSVFVVRCDSDGEKFLDADEGGNDSFYDASVRFLFLRPKN
ncbi:MAG: hypothetical protein NTU76_04800 [Candidatus Taylorbacteria bacterium]|nr:hypothetical protein [Candidatus Taylorbacteria bacterium]